MAYGIDPPKNRKIIVDTDMGLDDYWAVLILLDAEKSEKVNIQAITCAAGNAGVTDTCKNVVRLLQMIGRTDIPVYKGQDINITEPRKGYYGSDGFGDLSDIIEPDMSIVQEKPAEQAISDIVGQYPEEVSIITLAPLTNLANAIKTREDFKDQVKDIWIMGGNDPGNKNYKPSAEYNVNCNLEAADLVLNTFTCPVYILPWEACLDMKIPLEWRYNLSYTTSILDIVTRAEKKIYTLNNETEFLAADAVMAHVYLDLFNNVLKTEIECVEVEMTDPNTKGQLKFFTDPNEEIDPKIMIREVDPDLFKDLLVKIAKKY